MYDATTLYEKINALEQEAIKNDFENHYPVYPAAAQGKSLLTLLEKNFLKWAPRDFRLSTSYRNRTPLQYGPEDKFLFKVFQGLEIKPVKRMPLVSGVEFAILVPTNLSEFEAYNAAAERHNDRWMDQCASDEIFDPITGDERKVNGEVKTVSFTSRHVQELDTGTVYTGNLDQPIPKEEKRQVATIEARVQIEDNQFLVGYVCRNMKNKILYYSTIFGKDLSLIGRKMMHQLFGNPFQVSTDYVKGLYQGIPQLLLGKKTKIASNNQKPDWVEGTLKTSNAMEFVDGTMSVIYKNVGHLFTYVGSLLSLWYAIPKLFSGLTQDYGMEEALAIGIGGTFFSWVIGKWFYNQSEIKSRMKHFRF